MWKIVDDFIKNNPFVHLRRWRMRRGLKNKGMSLFCPYCMGGTLFHDLGLQFCSPTINLMMYQTDFKKFILHLDDYLKQEFVFFKHPDYAFPCAKLGDVTVHFTHYKSEQDAVETWRRRCKRIDRNNMFVMCSERDGLTKDDILQLGRELKVRGLLVFTENPYPDIPYTLQITDGPVTSMQSTVSHLTGERKCERLFDFVKWFNEANGGDYDISPYMK